MPAGSKPLLIVPSPAGAVFTQKMAHELAEEKHLAFACGRYEGIDERVLEWAAERFDVRPVSLGDYVLNGGEVAVLAMVEAIGRLVPGVVGNPESLVEESHSDGLLEYPVYTKPAVWEGRAVPEVLLGGNHGKVARHRRNEQLRRTATRRPDLILALDPATLNAKDRDTLWHAGFMLAEGRIVRRPEAPEAAGAADRPRRLGLTDPAEKPARRGSGWWDSLGRRCCGKMGVCACWATSCHGGSRPTAGRPASDSGSAGEPASARRPCPPRGLAFRRVYGGRPVAAT